MVRRCVFEEVECEVLGATLLSVEEAEVVPTEILADNYWWWLRSPGNQNCAAYVDDDGSIIFNGNHVSKDFGCIRPVFIFKSTNLQIGDNVEIYGIMATVISNCYALVEGWITMDRFDAESNDYEIAEIKRLVEEWFNELKKNCDKEVR